GVPLDMAATDPRKAKTLGPATSWRNFFIALARRFVYSFHALNFRLSPASRQRLRGFLFVLRAVCAGPCGAAELDCSACLRRTCFGASRVRCHPGGHRDSFASWSSSRSSLSRFLTVVKCLRVRRL